MRRKPRDPFTPGTVGKAPNPVAAVGSVTGSSGLIILQPLVSFPQALDVTPLALGTLTLPTIGLYTVQWAITAGHEGSGHNIVVSANTDEFLYTDWISSDPNADFSVPGVDGIWTTGSVGEDQLMVGPPQVLWVVLAPLVFTVYGYTPPPASSGGIGDLQFSAFSAGPSQLTP